MGAADVFRAVDRSPDGLLPELRECTVCGVVLEGVSYFHPLVDGLMCEGDKSWGATELSVDSQRLAAQMLRAPVENFVGCDWERTRAADLRRFLIQRMERHIEKRLVTAAMLAKI